MCGSWHAEPAGDMLGTTPLRMWLENDATYHCLRKAGLVAAEVALAGFGFSVFSSDRVSNMAGV